MLFFPVSDSARYNFVSNYPQSNVPFRPNGNSPAIRVQLRYFLAFQRSMSSDIVLKLKKKTLCAVGETVEKRMQVRSSATSMDRVLRLNGPKLSHHIDDLTRTQEFQNFKLRPRYAKRP